MVEYSAFNRLVPGSNPGQSNYNEFELNILIIIFTTNNEILYYFYLR